MADSELAANVPAATVEAPVAHLSQGEQVAKLLREGAAPPATETPETEPQAEQIPAEMWDIKSVAEKLKTDPAKLYESLKVAMADGEELTVSALKDAYKPVAEMTKARAALTEEMVTSRTQVEQARQELGQLVGLIGPQNVSPELLREVSRLAEVQRQAESQALLKAIPEWKDPITRAADMTDIRKVAMEEGYTEAEIRLAEQGYADHRMFKIALRAARNQTPPAKPAPKVALAPQSGKAPTPAQELGRLKAAVTKGQMSQTDAVARILKGI